MKIKVVKPQKRTQSLFNNDDINIWNTADGFIKCEWASNILVSVLPFVLNDIGEINKLILISDDNSLRYNTVNTLLSGQQKKSDKNPQESAKRLLTELTNVKLDPSDKWYFLGEINNGILTNEIHMVFGVCLDKLRLNAETERVAKISLINPNEIIQSTESIVLASYLRLLNSVKNEIILTT